jgi:hypothetical protein
MSDATAADGLRKRAAGYVAEAEKLDGGKEAPSDLSTP